MPSKGPLTPSMPMYTQALSVGKKKKRQRKNKSPHPPSLPPVTPSRDPLRHANYIWVIAVDQPDKTVSTPKYAALRAACLDTYIHTAEVRLTSIIYQHNCGEMPPIDYYYYYRLQITGLGWERKMRKNKIKINMKITPSLCTCPTHNDSYIHTKRRKVSTLFIFSSSLLQSPHTHNDS